MPRGLRPELVALAGSMVKMRVTGLWANGPGAVGAWIVGLPAASKAMRTMKSLPWLTTQHAPVGVEQAMSTGTDRNRRSVLARSCASSRPGGRARARAWGALQGWAARQL